jgi:hypothetical protein
LPRPGQRTSTRGAPSHRFDERTQRLVTLRINQCRPHHQQATPFKDELPAWRERRFSGPCPFNTDRRARLNAPLALGEVISKERTARLNLPVFNATPTTQAA